MNGTMVAWMLIIMAVIVIVTALGYGFYVLVKKAVKDALRELSKNQK